MAQVKPLRLRRQIADAKTLKPVGLLPVARVWVDSGVFHLDSPFDYFVPENFDESARVGVRVIVEFNGRECEGLIVSRIGDYGQKLKSIKSLVSPIAILSASQIELIERICYRWASNPFDVIRSAIPPRVARVDKEFSAQVSGNADDFSRIARTPPIRVFRQCNPAELAALQIAQGIIEAIKSGGVLVIVPDSRLLSQLSLELERAGVEYLTLDSNLSRSQRYENYLRAAQSQTVVIGTRSAIFSQVGNLATIIIYNEGSHNLYEVRSPGWNVRDIAILRSHHESLSLQFIGFSPSSEVARLLENAWLQYQSSSARISVESFPQTFGELLPGKIIFAIRKALKDGPVLFIAPRKGYAAAVMCHYCKNIARCTCGGKLMQRGSASALSCAHCSMSISDWQCSWCHKSKVSLLGRGIDRFAQEIGRAFPGLPIHNSQSGAEIESVTDEPALVLATPGMAPICSNGYAAVVILEGERFFAQPDMRSLERVREIYFSAASYLAHKAPMLLVLADNNPIVGALASWKPSLAAQRELRDREEVSLPPYVRAVTLDIESIDISSLVRGLERAKSENRLPQSFTILGPSALKNGKSRILLTSSLQDGEKMIALLHEFMRKRSIAKKPLGTMRIDPYSLSH